MNAEHVERVEFYSRCIESLKALLPREYRLPKYHNYHIVLKPIRGVYFEWGFLHSKFYVGLMFEKASSEINRELISKFEAKPMKNRLESVLKEDIEFDHKWRKGGKWSKLFIQWPNQKISEELERWAVEKMSILIKESEPVLLGVPRPPRRRTSPKNSFPDELPSDKIYAKVVVTQVLVNRYERSRKSKLQCLKAFENKYRCEVCGMNFRKRYGSIGGDFIHVHHRMPLSACEIGYELNPAKDLVPVCPNCHGMLHYGRPWDSPRTTDELREILLKQRRIRRKRRSA